MMNKKLKIALVHDWCYVNGGAEKVVKAINEIWPDIDNYTLFDVLNKTDRIEIFKGKTIYKSFIQFFPFLRKHHKFFFPFFKYAVEEFNLNSYDIVITSSAGFSKNIITNSNQLHVCYCHSPMRYAWDLFYHYTNKESIKNIFIRSFVKFSFHKLRIWDVIGSNRVDVFVANSKNISNRIAKTYKRNSKVIYPPVDIDSFSLCTKKESYYVTASRLVDYKRIDIIIEAFNFLADRKLLIIGDGPEGKDLKKLAKSKNIEFLGHIDKSELTQKIAKAQAFIFAANEDFGIVPLEAQACGTPVVAFGAGGSLETVIDRKTGMYFQSQNKDSLIDTLLKFENEKFDYYEIRKNAEKFSSKIFKQEFKNLIYSEYKEFITK